MKLSQVWARAQVAFDDENLVSAAGLAPVMALAERAGLSELLAERVRLDSNRVASAGVNPAGKLTSIIAGMAAGADSIEDLEVIRSGGMAKLFGEVYASATLGQFLREFTGGHVTQLASVARAHLLNLIEVVPALLPPQAPTVFVDIDSLLRPVYGHAKEGASFGHAKIAGRQVLRRGLSPLAATISTAATTPLVAEMRLRGGKTGSGKKAASMVKSAVCTARVAAPGAQVMVRGDSAFGNSKVITAVRAAGASFSLTLVRNRAVDRAIGAIGADEWTTVHYPGAVTDPDTGELISDAEVAEVQFTGFASTKHPVTARLIVRRVRDRAKPAEQGENGELFPVWRYHPFLTDSTEPAPDADITHRRHAIIETVFADLIDGPLAHLPSGRFPANAAWAIAGMMTHNLLRAAGTVAGGRHAKARGATLREEIINVPARTAAPQRCPWLHLPARWPWQDPWIRLWQALTSPATGPPVLAS